MNAEGLDLGKVLVAAFNILPYLPVFFEKIDGKLNSVRCKANLRKTPAATLVRVAKPEV